VQSVPIITKVEFKFGSLGSVLITSLCDKVCLWLRQVCGFLWFPPPIKLTATYNWSIVESGVKYKKNLKLFVSKKWCWHKIFPDLATIQYIFYTSIWYNDKCTSWCAINVLLTCLKCYTCYQYSTRLNHNINKHVVMTHPSFLIWLQNVTFQLCQNQISNFNRRTLNLKFKIERNLITIQIIQYLTCI
jgi:hypothetical protein